jgi:hypothetical protein
MQPQAGCSSLGPPVQNKMQVQHRTLHNAIVRSRLPPGTCEATVGEDARESSMAVRERGESSVH